MGRTICSTTCCETWISYGLGVAERKTTWGTRSTNSSKRNGRLSAADVRTGSLDDHRPGELHVTFRCWDPDGTEIEIFWDG